MGYKALLKQPQAFYFVFLIEILERFSYYGVSAVIVMYALHSLGASSSAVSATFATFLVLLFLPLFIGGYVNDRFIGDKKGVLLGALLLMSGYVTLIFANAHLLYLALGFILVGNLFFKVAAPSLLAKTVIKETRSLDSIFTMYYMAINAGSFLGMLCFPFLVRHYGTSAAFTLAAFNIFLIILLTFGFYNFIPEEKKRANKTLLLALVVSVIGAVVLSVVIRVPLAAHILYAVLGLLALWILFRMIAKEQKKQRVKIFVIAILMLEALVYFVLIGIPLGH